MKDMLDFFLFKDFNFFMICIGNIFVMIGFYVLFLYIVDYVLQFGIFKMDVVFLFFIIGNYSKILKKIIDESLYFLFFINN